MNKQQTLYLYGFLVILTGILIIGLRAESIHLLKCVMACCLIPAALLAFGTALKSKNSRVQFAYHELHALALVVYAGLMLTYCEDFECFIYLTTFFFVFYTFSEMVFAAWLFNLNPVLVYQIALTRILFGFVIGIGAIAILYHPDLTQSERLMGYGIIFIILGINILFYKRVMKTFDLPAFAKEPVIVPKVADELGS